MKILSKLVSFDWDEGNIDKNWQKHKVISKEAEEVFNNKPTFIFKDKRHSVKEKRYGIFGRTNNNRLLSIVFTLRESKVRIITARDISKKERRSYEKIKNDSKVQN